MVFSFVDMLSCSEVWTKMSTFVAKINAKKKKICGYLKIKMYFLKWQAPHVCKE